MKLRGQDVLAGLFGQALPSQRHFLVYAVMHAPANLAPVIKKMNL